jgi:hypothetical protein
MDHASREPFAAQINFSDVESWIVRATVFGAGDHGAEAQWDGSETAVATELAAAGAQLTPHRR